METDQIEKPSNGAKDHTKVKLPLRVKLTAERNPDDTVTFAYEEIFDPGLEKLVERTFDVAKLALHSEPITVECPDPLTLRIKGTCGQGRFANMIVAEFFAWSDLGRATIADLMISGLVGATVNAASSVTDRLAAALPPAD